MVFKINVSGNKELRLQLHALDAVRKGVFYYVPEAKKYDDKNFLRAAEKDKNFRIVRYCESKSLDDLIEAYNHVKAIPRIDIKATTDNIAKPTGGCYSTSCYSPFVKLNLESHAKLYREILMKTLDAPPWEIAEVEYVAQLGWGVTNEGPDILEIYGFVPWRTEYKDCFWQEFHSDYQGDALVTRNIGRTLGSNNPKISFRLMPFTSILNYKPLKPIGAGWRNAWDSLLVDLSENSDQ